MSRAGAAILACLLAASPALARSEAVSVDIPAGSLRSAIIAIGAQANVTIGIADPALAEIPIAPVRGRMSVEAALRRLLAGTPARFVAIDAQTFRIVARPRAAPKPSSPASPASALAGAQIIVTASKRSMPLDTYPGSVVVIDARTIGAGQSGHGSAALVAQLPILTSTNLGPGRNKLFVRGIADSSFNGPTQATVGQYLGEVRLNYNAPDPDLALYDLRSVEVLEGPQGTLYGAGSLGGIVRLVPNPPELAMSSLLLSAGGAIAAEGSGSGDAAAVFNLPIARDRLGLRAVVYGAIDGGYIDDPGRGLADINRTTVRGGRVTLRFRPGADWTIDLGGVLQNINSRDGQYADSALPPLQRSSVLPQPFDNDYALGSLIVRHSVGSTELISATSAVMHGVDSTYDASLSASLPRRYQEHEDILVLTNETRLSHTAVNGGGWVTGLELLHSTDTLTRTLGPPGDETRIAGTRNTVERASLFGEATVRFAPRWFVTGGARLGFSHLVGEVIDEAGPAEEPRRNEVSVLPSAGLLWKPNDRLALFARYQEGYRPGGLSVQAGATQKFAADSLGTYEFGARYGHETDRFHASAAVSYAHWENIQADLVDAAGLPYTANIGTGRIVGFEAQVAWRPRQSLVIEAAAFVNDSKLSNPAPTFVGERDASLPNIADVVARLSVRYGVVIAGHRIWVSGSAHYVGHSRLGVGSLLDLGQGGYVETALGVSLPVGRMTFSLDATNLLDARGNMFALGDPFGVTTQRQTTPMRPRTIRLGASAAF